MEGLSIATSILTRAVTLDTGGRYTEAFICYQEGLQILMEALKAVKDDDGKRTKLRAKVQEYMDRAEKLKLHIESLKSSGTYREQIQVEENSIGHSYQSIFSRFLETTVTSVQVDDPYVRSPHQCDNFLRFVELCVRLCPKLKLIQLTTGSDPNPSQRDQQSNRLNTIAKSLQQFQSRNISLTVEYSDSMHDREIRLDNGWVIKIGRGLDYFKPVDRLTVGWTDFELRPCKETTIDIFHKKELVKCH